MPMHPSHLHLQYGLRSLGYDPGPIDSWWGPRTDRAAQGLADGGPIKETPWAWAQLVKGLSGLGYLPLNASPAWTLEVRAALAALIDADGLAFASVADPTEILQPTKPVLRPVSHSNVLRQGSRSTVITGYCLHCAAVPGDWMDDKTDESILAAIHRMHTAPKSQGGRGWSDTGYHEVIIRGTRHPGRPLSRYGAGAIGYNVGWKHTVMIERRTIDRTRQPEDYFAPETLAAARESIAEFGQQTRFERLMGHREVAAKLCPGFDVIDRDWTDLAVA